MDKWKHVGALLGAMLTPIILGYMDLRTRVDSGTDAQRAHWQAERHVKDSIDAHRDSVTWMKQDSIIHLLNKKR